MGLLRFANLPGSSDGISSDDQEFAQTSYSQEGEDIVLNRFFHGQDRGFYVDIGAHHPRRFSNTLYYYQRGWRGLNVDVDPELMREFDSARPRDINIACGVGSSKKPLTLYVFNERAVNTMNPEQAQKMAKVKGWKIVEERQVDVVPLSELLAKNLPKQQTIDFMSVDVEGQDLDVLSSNDWAVFRPRFVIAECHDIKTLEDLGGNKLVKYMRSQDYVPVAKTLLSIILADRQTYEQH